MIWGGGSVLRLNWSATDETFRKTLSGLAKGALMTRDHTDISAETRRSVLLSVGGTAQANGALIRLINEDIGTAQARIEQATTRQQAAQVSATLARTNLIGADPYETATKLQDTISRVDQMFALTARLSRLSLSAYL